MSFADYERVLTALTGASRILASQTRVADPTDLRIRCLINIAEKEVRQALLDHAADRKIPALTDLQLRPIWSGPPFDVRRR